MKRLAAAAICIGALSFAPSLAMAQERLGDGALGALAGALVAGPVGLVVGAGVGYAAGPQISHRFSGHPHHRRYGRTARRGYHGRIR